MMHSALSRVAFSARPLPSLRPPSLVTPSLSFMDVAPSPVYSAPRRGFKIGGDDPEDTLEVNMGPFRELAKIDTRVSYLRHNDVEYALIGTFHSTIDYNEMIERVVKMVKPHTIVVEVDVERYRILRKRELFGPFENFWIRSSKTLLSRATKWTAALMWATRVFQNAQEPVDWENELKRKGRDMQFAGSMADKYGAEVYCGDRGQMKTVQRFMSSLVRNMETLPSQKDIVDKAIEGRKRFNENHDPRELSRFVTAPSGILLERDIYFARTLQEKVPGKRVVAVFGLGHLDGIERIWADPIKEQKDNGLSDRQIGFEPEDDE